MFNIAFSAVDGGESSEASSSNSFAIGELWKNGKLNIVTTLYLGFIIIALAFIFSILLLGGKQDILRPVDIRIITYICIVPMPLIIAYYLFDDWASKSAKRAAARRP
jgi:hypothetical protein